jgi:hypothetical protein
MSDFKRNRKAEAEFPFLEVLGDFIEAMNKIDLSIPHGSSTGQKKALDTPVPDGGETAVAVHPSSGRLH